MPAYIDKEALNRRLLEPRRTQFLGLLIDEAEQSALFAELKDLPEVSAVMMRRAAVDTFHETLARTLMIFVSFFSVFSCTLAFGVVYNTARIALSERGRELATLRVLGFTRWEISYILLGEVGLTVFLGLPLGCLAGFGLTWLITSAFETELYRVPLVIDPSTFGMAVVVVLLAAVVSGLLVRERLDGLDLIAVLKTRE
ncbi:MAG TPA: ABC transporter permease [Kiloniellaceae bacterium]|nr:ABC transporter permease [Kiloniellaceae bacterium]